MDELAASLLDRANAIVALRRFDGAATTFWPRCLEAWAGLIRAEQAVLVRTASASDGSWKQVTRFEAGEPDVGVGGPERRNRFAQGLTGLASEAARQGMAESLFDGPAERGGGGWAVAVRLVVPGDERITVAAFCVAGASEAVCATGRVLLRLATDVPADYARELALSRLEQDRGGYQSVLQIVAEVYGQRRYMAACMTLCNAIVHHYGCSQVSIGFLHHNEYVRMAAISGSARFDRRSDVIRAMEVVMEEAVDQLEEVIWPLPEGYSAIAREHEQYARTQGVDTVCTIPLRHGDTVAGAICCERKGAPFTESLVRQMALLCDVLGGRLGDLRRRDRWFLLRWLQGMREALGKLLGVEHTWAKLAGLAAVAALAVVLLGKAPYRVEAPFVLKADRTAFLSAPFDGFVESVAFDIGDSVRKDQELLAFDRQSLLLEKAAVLAEIQRHEREAEKRLAEQKLADMRISHALGDQAKARLELMDYRLARSSIRAPFDGVVVEGEWAEKLHAAVRQGDVLLRIVQLDALYVELEIDGADIAGITDGLGGEVAFISDPRARFPIRLERVHPAADPGAAGTVFRARARLACDPETWWRPGMRGIAKLDLGPRRLWWIFTHRTLDFLRRVFWW